MYKEEDIEGKPKIALFAGGTLEEAFTLSFLDKWQPDKVIAVDRGLLFLHEHGIEPDLIVGDFDSLPEGILEPYEDLVPVRKFIPEKDATDTEIGVRAALEMGAGQIALLGTTGSRIDHVLGNIQVLAIALQQGVYAFMQDSNNRISLLNKGRTLRKEQMFGDYISFLPLTTEVSALTLQGFRYPLEQYTLTSDNSLGVSNEVTQEEAIISLHEGILIMIESRDDFIA